MGLVADDECIEDTAFIGDQTEMDDEEAARVVCKPRIISLSRNTLLLKLELMIQSHCWAEQHALQ